MALEFERRFLVQKEDWKELAKQGQHLRQGYISSTFDGWTVRIRILAKKQAWITLKSPAKGISNYEYEYLVPLDDAEEIWELVPHKVIKTRYELNLSGGEWIVDCFEGKNSPLVLAEVELSSNDEIVEKPSWCGEELTGRYQWSNAALAQNPISNWSIETLKKNNLL